MAAWSTVQCIEKGGTEDGALMVGVGLLAGERVRRAATGEDGVVLGIALMDHLIQIPQVGSAWEPIPEQWVAVRVGRCRLQRGRQGKRPVDPDPDVP
jgi:hypothetical protein